jgi:DNA processing protein
MNPVLSANTQAILLLTAPLIAGRGPMSGDLLTPGEYKGLARHLRDIQRQPADLVSPDSSELIGACGSVVDGGRLTRLLGRGFLLSQVVERWRSRAIWVVSRADPEYPRLLKARLRENAPPVIYGCGDMTLLEQGGLAVVGSRQVDDALVEYTMEVGRLVAGAGRSVVSGGARGIDQAAMRGALEAGGRVCGVLADGLEQASMNREHRGPLLEGQLVLISPCDPSAGFNVGNAMQRNKLIYALADAALVVNSDLRKGGTWTGAVEQLDKLRLVPIYVRSTGSASAGLDALHAKGAALWPNPRDAASLEAVFEQPTASHPSRDPAPYGLFPVEGTVTPATLEPPASVPAATVDAASGAGRQAPEAAPSDADVLFATVREVLRRSLTSPKRIHEVAEALGVPKALAKAWLQRLVEEGVIRQQRKPAGYVVASDLLFRRGGSANG